MNAIKLTGQVDDQGRLSAKVPAVIPPGPVTVLIMPDEDDAGAAWMEGIAREWADELSDERQDIYTPADGQPVDES